MRTRNLHGSLTLLFFASGCAALIYEVVWFHLLQIAIGSSALSLSVLLGTFMGGMCLGSLLMPLVVQQRHHPLRVYACLEFAIAASGLLLLGLMPFVTTLYLRLGGHLWARLLVACVCLLPSTMAMGATLPAVAGWITTSPGGMSRVGFLYAGNLAGAVMGTLVAGFYLLRLFDVSIATFAAAAINIAAGAVALLLARQTELWPVAPHDLSSSRSHSAPGNSAPIYISIALSGFTALSAEIIWTRLLALSFGATVYTFSLILAAVLIGLGAGSTVASFIQRRPDVDSRTALGWSQVLIGVAIAWAAYVSTHAIPFGFLSASASSDPWRTFRYDFVRALLAVLPGAVLWGASFPFALASVAVPGTNARRVVSTVYAANTVGAILGSVATSLLLSGSVGSQHVQQLLIAMSAVSGALALMAKTGAEIRFSVWLAIGIGVAILTRTVTPIPGPLVAYGRRTPDWVQTTRVADTGTIIFAGEGLNEFIAVSRGATGELTYHASGKVQASTLPPDMRLQLLLAHISHLVPARPANVLVIGCGAGITAGALALGPGVEHVTVAEIEPLVPKVAAAYFGEHNHHLIQNPRVSLRIDDGRHVLATTTDTFDVIATDLTDPWVKGVAALFTEEFFELAKRHLRPGGVVTQFVQLYQSNVEAVKSEIATFVKVFPNSVLWGNPQQGEGYDLVLLGQVDPIRIDVDALQEQLAQPAYRPVLDSLRIVGIDSAVDLLATYTASGADLGPWLRDAAINRDRDFRLQYLAGLGLNVDESRSIYLDMLRFSTFPSAVFVGSPAAVQQLKAAIASFHR